MITLQIAGTRLGLAILGTGMLIAAAPAAAQTGNPAFDTPGAALSRNLKSLAENPRSLSALMGAGKAALELGDPQGAINFFGRAEEQAPRDGRIKMYLGAALVHLQQASGAHKFFEEAVRLGVPQAEVARERGLAYDIGGDPRRAQSDYRLALQHKRDPETTRRLALSLAISGEREPALKLLEEQLLVRDRAAERTKAFVLALTGDAPAALRAVQTSMPGAQGSALAPFLERLPALNLSERALAVHLGHFPQRGRNLPVPPRTSYAALDGSLRAGAPDGNQSALGGRAAGSAPRSTADGVRRAGQTKAEPRRQEAGKPAAPSTQAAQTPLSGTRRADRSGAAAAPAGAQQKQISEAQRRINSIAATPWGWSRGIEPKEPAAAAKRPAERTAMAAATSRQIGGTVRPAPAPAQTPPVQSQTAPQAGVSPPSAGQGTLASSAPAVTARAQVASPGPVQSVPQSVQMAARPELGQVPVQQTSVPAQSAATSSAAAAVQQPSVQQPSIGQPAEQRPIQLAELAPSAFDNAPGFSIVASQAAVAAPTSELAAVVEAPAPASAPVEEGRASRLADVAATIAAIPETAPPVDRAAAPAKPAPTPGGPAKKEPQVVAKKPAPAVAKKEAPAPAKKAPTAAPATKEAAKKAAAPAEPSRHWVQVAGGADKASLPRELARL
jgi:Flp pilus assembly protein TadD